jgi:hypothetical protein
VGFRQQCAGETDTLGRFGTLHCCNERFRQALKPLYSVSTRRVQVLALSFGSML